MSINPKGGNHTIGSLKIRRLFNDLLGDDEEFNVHRAEHYLVNCEIRTREAQAMVDVCHYTKTIRWTSPARYAKK